ncbi:MAG: NAD-dependent epimerase/dehydratase family protein [Reyranellaceae bacterium]
MERASLILGGSGSFGGAVAREMLARGWRVRALARDPARLALAGAEAVQGDALDGDGLSRAGEGAAVIVHGVNYPYHQWTPNMERVTSNVLRAARSHGATVLFPGNVYGFGPQADAPLPETAGMRPSSEKGRLRVRLETMLRAATLDGGARALVVRAGDYFGPTVRNGLVDRIFGHAVAGKPMQVFGRTDIAHQWAYVPDLARLAVALLERAAALEPFEIVHDRGHVGRPQLSFLRAVAAQAGRPELKIRRVPWLALRAAGLFDPVVRELMELRYLFDTSIVIDDPRRQALLSDFRWTPVEEAIARTVGSYRAQ